MGSLIDQIWILILAPVLIIGAIANKYNNSAKQTNGDNELFPYYRFELPTDSECSDLPNKKKWLHKYRIGRP